MSRNLKLYIAGVVAMSALALIATTFCFPIEQPIAHRLRASCGPTAAPSPASPSGSLVTLVASALPVQMPRGTLFAVSIAPIMAATILGGPAAGAWVALIGTTEVRELRGRIPWYGTLANHAGIVLPAVAAGLVMRARSARAGRTPRSSSAFIVVMHRRDACSLASTRLAVRRSSRSEPGSASERAHRATPGASPASILSLAPIGWLMAQIYMHRGVGEPAVRAPALHDAARRTRTTPRCARCSPRPSRALAGGGGQARSRSPASTRGGSRRSPATSGG